jgi:glycosyltransferase involved in cell wall biosynthesis
MIKLSIIVPIYNVEQYIRPCFESVFNQGLNDDEYEVIIVNDGSTDRSMEMIEDIISQHTNITIINQENQGLSVARNNGIKAAKGEYILMPDSDDLLIEYSLKPLLETALESQADLIVADFLRMNDEEINNYPKYEHQNYTISQKEATGYELFMEDIIPNECYVWRTLYKREFILNNNLTFVPGIYFQDVPFTHECYLRAHKCIRTNRILNIYRRGHQSASAPSSFKMKNARDLCIAITKSWELRNIKGLPGYIKRKSIDSAFIMYGNLLYRTIYGIEGVSQKVHVLKMLKAMAPDLKFTNNAKQFVASSLFRHAPRFIVLSLIIKKLVKMV